MLLCLFPSYKAMGLKVYSTSIPGELVRDAGSCRPPSLTESELLGVEPRNLFFAKVSRGYDAY